MNIEQGTRNAEQGTRHTSIFRAVVFQCDAGALEKQGPDERNDFGIPCSILFL